MSRRALTVALAAVGALLVLSGSAQALSPAPLPADVVFSNGGRILSIGADGSERKVLFGKNRAPKNDEWGAVDPAVSPDRTTIVFGFRREARGRTLTDIWKVGSDGLDAKRILVSKQNRSYGDPTFTWDGDLVVAFFERGGGFTRSGLVRVDLTGRITQRIFEVKEKRRPFRQSTTIAEPDLTDQGRKVLYVAIKGADGDFSDEGFQNDLMVRDLVNDQTRKVAGSVYDASWSWRGDKVVYSRQNPDGDLEICWWESGCGFQSSLEIVNADGSGRRVLTNPKLDARSPDWSNDNRIVFQSARNLPSAGEANEIYSVRPDGGCLTMLTNGSPASLTPAWSDGSQSDTSTGGCGVPPSEPLVEVKGPGQLERERFWFGPRSDSRLLTDLWSSKTVSVFMYNDCDRLAEGDCLRPSLLISSDVCRARGQIAGLARDYLRLQRGVPVFISRGAEIGDFVIVLTGRTFTYFTGGSGKGRSRGTRELGQLRPAVGGVSSGDLPPAMIPAQDIKMMEQVVQTYKSAGSVPAAAKRLGIRPRKVRDNLKFSRVIGKFGEYERINCSR